MPPDWRIGVFWPVGPRVEDPIRIKLLSDAISSLSWTPKDMRESLLEVFNQLSILTHAELRYYYARRKAAGRRAVIFRIVAWTLGSAGLLLPLLQPLIQPPLPNLLAWGYLSIAVAGSFVVADKVFSGTEGHSRYVGTQLDLERQYTQFALEWQASMVLYDVQPSAKGAVELLALALKYADSFHKALASETSDWKATMTRIQGEIEEQTSPSSKNGAP